MLVCSIHVDIVAALQVHVCDNIWNCVNLCAILQGNARDYFFSFFFFSEFDYKSATGSSNYRFGILAKIVKHMKVWLDVKFMPDTSLYFL